MIEGVGVGGILATVCGGICLVVVAVIVIVAAVGGSLTGILSFGTAIWAKWFRKDEPRGTATSYSMDQGREAGVDPKETDSRAPSAQDD
ncbi:MAG: hypothetical protein GF320_06420 [Armatimonadia bacterium]|nr:hypothetical protein [Armatimonadia bacterium]